MSSSEKKQYYYANSEQVVLDVDDDFVAFDLDDIKKPTKKFKAFVEKHAEQLRKSVYLVSRSDLTDDAKTVIDDNNAWRRVFRTEDTLTVVLPEIRVKDGSTKDLKKIVSSWVKKNKSLARMKQDKSGRVVVEPICKSGDDALEIAKSLVEELKVDSATPRLVQKISSPRPKKK